jgi:hypothetical protein
MKNILLLFPFLLVLSSCKKSVGALPEPTQTGANTFGLKLNGEFWIPQKFAGINAPVLEALYTGLGDLRINARNFASEPTETEFEIYVRNVTGPGVYRLNTGTDIYPNASDSYAYYVKRKINPLNEWITNQQYTGTVTITTLSLENHIAAGTFQFVAGSIDSSVSPITVTEGRFDVKLQ